MTVRRVVPDFTSNRIEETRQFYVDVFGFEIGMDMGWVLTLVSPSNPTAQITIQRHDPAADLPDMTIEVDDVDAAYSAAVGRGDEIAYPLRDEDWGVRRFFVRDLNGVLINVMTHLPTG
jgi:catechol 2,3-dioxygenase-like lactoylglutathione lyase family enzyme